MQETHLAVLCRRDATSVPDVLATADPSHGQTVSEVVMVPTRRTPHASPTIESAERDSADIARCSAALTTLAESSRPDPHRLGPSDPVHAAGVGGDGLEAGAPHA